jgi:hypothetical protein
MKHVYGEDCKTSSSGIVDEDKDRLDYLFSQPIDREKLKIVEQKAEKNRRTDGAGLCAAAFCSRFLETCPQV